MSLAPQHRIYVIFLLFAFSMGSFMARLPDLQTMLGVNKSELGLLLTSMAVASLISLTLSSPVIVWLGTRMTSLITIFGCALLLALVPWIPFVPVVVVLLFFIGLLSGAVEINLNVEIGRLEQQLGFGIMNRAHGFWSIGFFLAASSASVIRQAGVSIHMHLLAMLAVVLLAGCWAMLGMKNAPPLPDTHDDKAPLVALPTLGLLPLCVIGISAFLVEGAGIDWSAIYMRDTFAVEPFVGGLGLTAFALCMAFVRVIADGIVDRYGARPVAVVMLATAAIGIAMVWLAPHPYVALLGFALMGGGCSAVYPMAVSAAAARTDRPSFVNVAALAQMSFVVFFLGPPLLGFVAESWSMRTAYLVCLPLVIFSILASSALSPAKKG